MRAPARRTAILLLSVLPPLALSACGGGGVVRRINPPVAAIQQLAVQPDGSWSLSVRINNFSTVPMRFERVAATLELGGHVAATLDAALDLEIPGQSADVFPLSLRAGAGAARALTDAESQRREVAYKLHGEIASSEPDDRFDFEYESRLAPVPGRTGEFR
jgi:hypothetical protein